MMRAVGALVVVALTLDGCGAAPRPPTLYSPGARGTIDLSENPDARHCSELTRDFRDAYGLEGSVEDILAVAVPADESSMTIWTRGGTARSSLLIGDRRRLRAFWHYEGWTLAVLLDHGSCRGDRCPAEIALIKYNGAKTPADRPNKLCFERWVGTFDHDRRRTIP
jgi:hypothetical protein